MSIINDLKTKLIASTDVESFINRNSDYQYNDRYLSKKTFTSKYADTILALGSGTVYGPYMEGNSYFVVKVMDKKSLPDSVVKTQENMVDIVTKTFKKNGNWLDVGCGTGAPACYLAKLNNNISITGINIVKSQIIKAKNLAKTKGYQLYIPKFEYCTDNAAMIAITGYFKYLDKDFADQSETSSARLSF
mgnify:CR=1 FL=1